MLPLDVESLHGAVAMPTQSWNNGRPVQPLSDTGNVGGWTGWGWGQAEFGRGRGVLGDP